MKHKNLANSSELCKESSVFFITNYAPQIPTWILGTRRVEVVVMMMVLESGGGGEGGGGTRHKKVRKIVKGYLWASG